MTIRVRFSIRTLAIIVTLVCAYLACWGPTKRRGVRDVVAAALDIRKADDDLVKTYAGWFNYRPVMPLVVEGQTPEHIRDPFLYDGAPNVAYYFWFFGYVAKLPYERELEV